MAEVWFLTVSKLEAGYNLKECFALTSVVTERAFNTRLRPFTRSDGYAMLMSSNKGKAAIHGCHCPDDMAVSMPEVMARLWVGVGVRYKFTGAFNVSTFTVNWLIQQLISIKGVY